MFDAAALGVAIATHGPVARVVIAGFEGSSPREVGAAMLVWSGGAEGTIGGGALEWEALAKAREMLGSEDGSRHVERVALGPSLGQCCGGAVTLWFERFDWVPEVQDGVFARGPGEMPLAVKRICARVRGQGVVPVAGLVQGWLVEPVARPMRQVWVWGAGHVGRAVVGVLAPLPGVAVTWCDVDAARFPDVVPEGVRVIARRDVEAAVAEAPAGVEHLVMTFSHALDLELCHRLLGHGFGTCGLIGSATKWARFRSRLTALGRAPAQIARIDCPIGNPGLGKHPQAIAIGVAAAFLSRAEAKEVAAHG